MRRTIITACILLLSALLPVEAVKHHALIFGIGKYQDKTWMTIHGDNDVDYVTSTLQKCGFKDIVSLKNEKATKQGMVRAFRALENRCSKGDVVYIHYSGHGQLMTDVNGDEALRTSSRYGQWDESWVPYDACMTYCDKDDGSRHLCDDEVEKYLSAIRKKIGKSGKMTVVIDCCHSGDATRGEMEEAVRGVDAKFIIPKTIGEKHRPTVVEEDWLTISACKPYQLCMEMKGKNIGKLTYALCSLGKKMFTLSNEELQQRLNTFMEQNKGILPQTPVISGNR